jgi:hypothetical protein
MFQTECPERRQASDFKTGLNDDLVLVTFGINALIKLLVGPRSAEMLCGFRQIGGEQRIETPRQESLQDVRMARVGLRQVEQRDWWLWVFALAVTLVLTIGVVSMLLTPASLKHEGFEWFDLQGWIRGLAAPQLLHRYGVLHLLRRVLLRADG